MSCKVMYTCDHCGKEVSPYIGKQWKAGFLTVGPNIDDIHACSKEHLTLALAKTFDIPLDASTLRLVTEKNEALETARAVIIERDTMRARLAELEARMPANEVTNAERMQYETTIELQQKRIAELEKRIAELTEPMTVDGKTPGQVALEAWNPGANGYSAYRDDWERSALAVLRAFGQPSQTTQDAAEALRRVRKSFAGYQGECAAVVREAIDDELAKLEAKPTTNAEAVAMYEATKDAARRAFPDEPQAITLPTKPTKPLRERLEELASYWEKGAASGSMSEGYRQASKDCAKELREVINDPR